MGSVYTRKFTRTLNKKLRMKKAFMDSLGIDLKGAARIADFPTWDGRFTAPLHGYSSAEDYYTRASSGPVLKDIRIPTLIVNALNDPFLGESCFPVRELSNHPFVQLKTPARGGHVGFLQNGEYVSEKLALEFLMTK